MQECSENPPNMARAADDKIKAEESFKCRVPGADTRSNEKVKAAEESFKCRLEMQQGVHGESLSILDVP